VGQGPIAHQDQLVRGRFHSTTDHTSVSCMVTGLISAELTRHKMEQDDCVGWDEPKVSRHGLVSEGLTGVVEGVAPGFQSRDFET
jgi:hypothetical protein